MTALDGSGERHVYPQPDIVIERLPDCERCGAELWSRNGTKGYTIVSWSGLTGTRAPIMEPHMWLFNCRPGETG